MAGLVPAIHIFDLTREDVDARDKRGHDDSTNASVNAGRHRGGELSGIFQAWHGSNHRELMIRGDPT
jgi:hypothetical protein